MIENKNISISVLIPVFNEEKVAAQVLENAIDILENKLKLEYEILVFNDGSTDRTGQIVESLAQKHDTIKAFQNGGNKGIGYSVKEGIRQASKRWFVVIPGDYQFIFEDIESYPYTSTEYDLIIGYIKNVKIRTLLRRIISNGYRFTVNFLFGLRLKYIGGMSLFKTEKLKQLHLSTDSAAIFSEIIVKLIKQGNSYTYAGFHLRERRVGKSQVLRIKSVFKVLVSILKLWKDINFQRRGHIERG